MDVYVDRHYREQILELSKEGATRKNPDYKELGYRRINQFRSLAKAPCLQTHPGSENPRVHRANVEFLRKLSKFVSFKKAENLEELSSSSDSSE